MQFRTWQHIILNENNVFPLFGRLNQNKRHLTNETNERTNSNSNNYNNNDGNKDDDGGDEYEE